MIRLTRLNNHLLTVNSDLIKFVEQSPDTLITLINGEKLVVRESADEVVALLIAFRRSVLQSLGFTWDGSACRPSQSDPSQAHGAEDGK